MPVRNKEIKTGEFRTTEGTWTTKKIPGLLEAKEQVRFQYLKENQGKYNIKKACKTLNVSRDGYYKYLHRKPSKRDIENEVLKEEINRVFEEYKGR